MWQIYLNCHQKMGILNLKKRVNCDKCSFTTKQCMFGVFAIDEILRYRGSPFPASRTLCHPAYMELGTLMLEHGGVPGSDKNTFSHCLYVILLYPLSKHAKSSMTSTQNGDEVGKCLLIFFIFKQYLWKD